MSNFPSLIDFWKIKRKKQGLHCQVLPFHHLIASDLTKLLKGTLDKPNLMVLMPPRCAKTDLGAKTFIPYAQSWFPDSETIIAGYAQELPVESTIDIRKTLCSDWYQSMVDDTWGARMPMRGNLAGGSQDFFYTSEGGSIKAVGRGGGITGFGAGKLRQEYGGCILIDDLLKANEARSAAARKDAWSYISGTLNSRRNRLDDPPTPRILIMQRLHPEDPAGMLLREERDKWHVLQIPAHDEKGTVIWPGRLSMAELELMRETDPETYWAQYMQEPSQSARTIFNKDKWQYWKNRYELERQTTLKIITSDTAFEEKTSADWSVFQCWNILGCAGMALTDQIRGQWGFPDLLKAASSFWEKHSTPQTDYTPATEFWIENKASGISLVQTLRTQGLPARPWEPKDRTPKDKVGRAKHSTIPIHTGRVFLPDPKMPGFEWVEKFINEHSAFTDDDSHLNDDQVDAHTEASSIWQERGGGVGPLPNSSVFM